MTVVDSHLHVWDPRRFEYPWLVGDEHLNRPFTPADLDLADINAVIVVQADTRDEDALEEVRWVESLAASGALPVAGMVAFAPIDEPRLRDRALDDLSGSPSVVGVRRLLQDEDEAFLRSPELLAGLLAVRERELTFDACVRWQQIPALSGVLERTPGLRVVLDHLGKPPVRAGLDSESGRAWLQSVKRLAALEQVAVKLSGLPAESPDADLASVAPPFVTAAIEAFGTDRCMVGSDWPVSTGGRAPITSRGWFDLVTAGLSAADRAEVLGGTARRWYRLTDPVESDRSDV